MLLPIFAAFALIPVVEPETTLSDVTWSFSENQAQEILNAAKDYHKYTHFMRSVSNDKEMWTQLVEDAQSRVDVWWNVMQISNKKVDKQHKLCYLANIKNKIGCAAYYNGSLPPPAPFWYLQTR